ncbi:MAG: DNA topoisomerase IV [Flavobacteriaceae bacterium]|nr:DNA topoisomerase IV [Flavobacteriaceae bacterium]|tara:strand:- start:669 stop:1202 length:534 start_codon:yes stop_codon:yes gene_type:complete
MKQVLIIIALIAAPFIGSAQSAFDAFENEKDVTSVVVTKNMFKLLSKMDLESDDAEVKEYLKMIDNLENIKIFTTDNPEVAGRMNSAVGTYLSGGRGLEELMRVKEDGKDIKFYSKEGKNENFVSELLMHLQGNVEGKNMSVIMSITGNIDLKQISKLTKDLNVPGGENLDDLNKNK